MTRFARFTAALFFLLGGAFGTVRGQGLRTVPLDHWGYRAADELLLRHPELGTGIYFGARPWREADFETIVDRAKKAGLEDGDSFTAGLVRLLDESFVQDREAVEGTENLTVDNEVSAVGEASVRKDDATFDPPFLPEPLFGGSVGEPEARAFLQHDLALQVSDRFALGWRYVVDSDVRNDPTRFRQTEFRRGSDAGFTVLDAYGVFHWGPLFLTGGRNALSYGQGETTSVFISDSIPPIDQARIEIGISTVRFTGIIARLSSDRQNRSLREDGSTLPGSMPPENPRDRRDVNRLLYLHRVDWQIHPRLQVAVSEAALATGIDRGLEVRYGNLMVPFFVTQKDADDREGVNTNIVVNVEGVLSAPHGIRLYGDVYTQEFFVDKSKRDSIGNQLAWKLGGEWGGFAGLPGITAGAEYTRVDVFTYLHRGLNTNWTQFGVPIGSSLGPDADQGQAWLSWYPRPTLRLTADAMARRAGERSVQTLESVIDAGNPDFPSGTVQRELRLGVEAWGMLPMYGLEGTARVSVRDVNNVGNEPRDGRYWRVFLGLRWRWQLQ